MTYRVLVVDDSPTIHSVAQMTLCEYGCEVDTAINGVEGLMACEEQDYDLILLDLEMPLMHGKEVYEELQGSGQEQAVWFMSVHHDDDLRQLDGEAVLGRILPKDNRFHVRLIHLLLHLGVVAHSVEAHAG